MKARQMGDVPSVRRRLAASMFIRHAVITLRGGSGREGGNDEDAYTYLSSFAGRLLAETSAGNECRWIGMHHRFMYGRLVGQIS